MRFLVLVLTIGLLGLVIWYGVGKRETRVEEPAVVAVLPSAVLPPVSSLRRIVLPTERETLDPEVPGVFQSTAAGTVQSALYGSVRTARLGKGLAASFHEGVDIAPVRRDARGRPLDEVRVIADGTVAHINRQPGNSNYGNYIVVTHSDPLGEIYSLYAHLAAVTTELRTGQRVTAGDVLGLMGNTPSVNIPVSRSHLHFEIGLICNARFGGWFRAQRLTPDHGVFNGMNLQALDPLVFFAVQRDSSDFEFGQFLRKVPTAFSVLVPMTALPDYFKRYPSLWKGERFGGGWAVLSCSENGTVLAGRQAVDSEIRGAVGSRCVVLEVDEKVLGRNGCHLIVPQKGHWRLGPKGERWLEILRYQ
jgi:murein DD-endopeptidase MepM/ murein hydrolase activator NlpD